MSIRLSYIVAVISGAVMALSVRYYSVVTENSDTRLEVFEYQQKLESVQSQIRSDPRLSPISRRRRLRATIQDFATCCRSVE